MFCAASRTVSSIRLALVSGRLGVADPLEDRALHLRGERRRSSPGAVGFAARAACQVRRDLQRLDGIQRVPGAVLLGGLDLGQPGRRHQPRGYQLLDRGPCSSVTSRCPRLRGAIQSIVRSSSSLLPLLSIQPKHSASSTGLLVFDRAACRWLSYS